MMAQHFNRQNDSVLRATAHFLPTFCKLQCHLDHFIAAPTKYVLLTHLITSRLAAGAGGGGGGRGRQDSATGLLTIIQNIVGRHEPQAATTGRSESRGGGAGGAGGVYVCRLLLFNVMVSIVQ